mgnify:CR=1 FL=1
MKAYIFSDKLRGATREAFEAQGLYCYDLRTWDMEYDGRLGYNIEPWVVVNNEGSIVTDTPIEELQKQFDWIEDEDFIDQYKPVFVNDIREMMGV